MFEPENQFPTDIATVNNVFDLNVMEPSCCRRIELKIRSITNLIRCLPFIWQSDIHGAWNSMVN